MIRALLACLCLGSSSLAAADIAGVHCMGPKSGPVRVLEDDDGACRGFSIAGKEQYFTRMASGTLLVSKDSRTIVLVEDYVHGSIDGSAIVTLVGNERIVNPTVVYIWRDGKRMGMYDVARLVKDVQKVSSSISHVDWVAQLPKTVDGPKFSLTTTSGREITFDVKSGNIVDERDVPATPKTW